MWYVFQSACRAMSGKACSSNVVQAQKLVDQLQLEAGMERIKACSTLSACSRFLSYVDTHLSVLISVYFKLLQTSDLADSCRFGPVLSGAQTQRPSAHGHRRIIQPF